MSDFTIAELRLAFGYHFARLVLESDRTITLSENDFLQRHFAREDMGAAGFMDSAGAFTLRHTEALRKASVTLPEELSVEERLSLIEVLLGASLADSTFDTDEGSILEQAAVFLHIPDDALDTWLASHASVAVVDLPEPE